MRAPMTANDGRGNGPAVEWVSSMKVREGENPVIKEADGTINVQPAQTLRKFDLKGRSNVRNVEPVWCLGRIRVRLLVGSMGWRASSCEVR